MSTRREPPDSKRSSPTDAGPAAATESTALMERPMFSDDDAGDADRGVFDDDDDEAPTLKAPGDSDITDPNGIRAPLSPRSPAGDEAPTGRFDLSSLDDLDGLPSAHISELDGDVQEGGAQTAIMQLPPEMMSHDPDARSPASPDGSATESVEMRRWSAGRAGARHDMPVPGPPLPSSEGAVVNSTLPALSLDAIRAAAEGLHAVATPPPPPLASSPLPLPPPPPPQSPVVRAEDLPRAAPPGAMRQLIEDALAAVTAAQTCAQAHPEDGALHRQLGRAVAALSQLLDQTD